MLLRRPVPAETAAAAAAAAAAEDHVRYSSCCSGSPASNSRINLMLLHAPQLQRLKLQAPIAVDKSTTSAAAAQINSTGSPDSARSAGSRCSSYCGSDADSVQVRCGLVGRASSDCSAPGSPTCSPKHWTPGQLQKLLLQLLPLSSDHLNESSRIYNNYNRAGSLHSTTSSRGGGGDNPTNRTSRSSSSGGSITAPGVMQAQRALHRLHLMLACPHSSDLHSHPTHQLLEAFSCVDAEPAVVRVLVSLLDDTRLIDPAASLDTFAEAAAHVICALTAHESSIANRDVLGKPELGLPAAVAKLLLAPPKAVAEFQLGYSLQMRIEAARIVCNLTAYKHSSNQTILGRTEGVIPGLTALLCEPSAGEGRVAAAEALVNIMFDHQDNIMRVGKTKHSLAGLAGLLNVDPDRRMAPKHACQYQLAACKVLYLLAGQSSLKAGIMQYDSLAIPSSLEELLADRAIPTELQRLAQAVLAQLNGSKGS